MDMETDAQKLIRENLIAWMQAQGVSDAALLRMAWKADERAIITGLVFLIAEAIESTERVRQCANPDPRSVIGTNRGL